MIHYYDTGGPPYENDNWTKGGCLLATPHQCGLRTKLQYMCHGLKSRGHCPDQSVSSVKLS
jgi:hypothetical protein